jgi:hypothetical protein
MKLFKKLMAIGVFTLPACLMATEPVHYLRAHIPFSFIIAGHTFAPGDYIIQESDTGVVTVEGRGAAVFAISAPSRLVNTAGNPELIFANKQQHKYLVGVDTGTIHESRSIPVPAGDLTK